MISVQLNFTVAAAFTCVILLIKNVSKITELILIIIFLYYHLNNTQFFNNGVGILPVLQADKFNEGCRSFYTEQTRRLYSKLGSNFARRDEMTKSRPIYCSNLSNRCFRYFEAK